MKKMPIKCLYDEKIKSGEIKPDLAQKKAVEHLDHVFDILMLKMKSLQRAKPSSSGLWQKIKSTWSPEATVNASDNAQGLYFYGPVGRGKSMLMDMFFDVIPVKNKKRVHFHAFMLSVHDFLHKTRKERNVKSNDRIDTDILKFADKISKEADLLCFDEFQVDDVADAMILGRLFTALFDAGVVVILTSNTAPKDLYKGGLQRELFLPFIDVLSQKLKIIDFEEGCDYRLQTVRELGVYFTPLNTDSEQKIAQVFDKLTDAVLPKERNLMVKGRDIVVPRAVKDVAWFSFDDLCVEAKSVADYLEITKYFNTIVLSGVPALSDEMPNPVRRFIHLIDTLYENKTRLIMSSEKEPMEIYKGRDKAFSRTESRLIEMQSKDYWSKNI